MSNAYWIYANIEGQRKWYIAIDRGCEVYFPEIDFEEEMSIEEYKEEFPHFQVSGPIVGPGSCTCDAPGDGMCPVHWETNQLQDRALMAEAELEEIKELVGPGGDGTAKGRVGCMLLIHHRGER